MQDPKIFFDGWANLGRSLVLAVLAYGALVFLPSVSGKRTLSKMNVFDFVFVVALGSTLATTILSPGVTLADGVLAPSALFGLQVALSRLCTKSHLLDRVINGEPALFEELLAREPVAAAHHLVLHHRDVGGRASEGYHPELEEQQRRLPYGRRTL
jgi:hypothetical protein